MFRFFDVRGQKAKIHRWNANIRHILCVVFSPSFWRKHEETTQSNLSSIRVLAISQFEAKKDYIQHGVNQ
jgi:hypothetical protein